MLISHTGLTNMATVCLFRAPTWSPWRHLPSVYVDTVDKGIKMHNTILAQRQIFCLVLLFFYLSFAVFLCCHSDFDTDFFFTMAANKICFCFDPNEHEQIYQYGAWLFLLVPTWPAWRHELGIFMKHLALDQTSKLLITIMRQKSQTMVSLLCLSNEFTLLFHCF